MKLEVIKKPLREKSIVEEIEDSIKIRDDVQEIATPPYADALRQTRKNRRLAKERTKGVREITNKVREATAPQTKEIKESVLSDKGREYLKRRNTVENKQELTEGTSNYTSYNKFPLLVFLTEEEVMEQFDYYSEDAFNEYIAKKYPNGEFESIIDYAQEEEVAEFREENDERLKEEFFLELETTWLDNYELEELRKRIEEVNAKIKNLYYELDDKEYEDELTEEESDDKDYLYDLKIGIEGGYYSGTQLTINNEYDFDHLSQGVRDKILSWVNDIKKEFNLTQLSVAYRYSNGETGYNIVEKKECDKECKKGNKKCNKECKEELDENVKLISDLSEFKPFGDAVEVWNKINKADKVGELEFTLEDLYPEGITNIQLNDLLSYDSEWVLDILGIASNTKVEVEDE